MPGDAAGWQNLAVIAQQSGRLRAGRQGRAARPSTCARTTRSASCSRATSGRTWATSRARPGIWRRPCALAPAVRAGPEQPRHHPARARAEGCRGGRIPGGGRGEARLHARAWNNLGSTLLHMERATEAVECFRKALALDPKLRARAPEPRPLPCSAIGRHRRRGGEPRARHRARAAPAGCAPRARRLYPRVDGPRPRATGAARSRSRLNPRGVDALLALGEVVAEKGNRDAALDCYRQAIALRPSSLRARIGLALTLPQIYADAQADRRRARRLCGRPRGARAAESPQTRSRAQSGRAHRRRPVEQLLPRLPGARRPRAAGGLRALPARRSSSRCCRVSTSRSRRGRAAGRSPGPGRLRLAASSTTARRATTSRAG